MPEHGPREVPCVGAIVRDDQGRLLLVRRGNAPSAGLWSLPGGRVEPGESEVEAVVREVAEETGLVVEPERVVGIVRRPGRDGSTYVISDYACTVRGGTLAAADDAVDATWASLDDLDALALVPQLRDVLEEWGELPDAVTSDGRTT